MTSAYWNRREVLKAASAAALVVAHARPAAAQAVKWSAGTEGPKLKAPHLARLPEVSHPLFAQTAGAARQGADLDQALRGVRRQQGRAAEVCRPDRRRPRPRTGGSRALRVGSDWPHPTEQQKQLPNDAVLFDLLTDWVPDEKTRDRVLVENPATLCDFPKGA